MVPETAFKFEAEMDPAEVLDYQIRLRDSPKLLEDDETFTSYTLTFYPEAIALGLELGTGAYVPVADGTSISVWFQINEDFQQDAAFDGDGADLPMELSIVTSNNPARKRQRTLKLGVKQL